MAYFAVPLRDCVRGGADPSLGRYLSNLFYVHVESLAVVPCDEGLD